MMNDIVINWSSSEVAEKYSIEANDGILDGILTEIWFVKNPYDIEK